MVAKVVDKVVDKVVGTKMVDLAIDIVSQQAGFGDSRVTSTIGLLRIKASTVNFQ